MLSYTIKENSTFMKILQGAICYGERDTSESRIWKTALGRGVRAAESIRQSGSGKNVLGDVVDLFTNNLHMEGSEEDQDLLGRTYEYCIAQFAAKEGKGGGEFYTPGCVVRTLVEVLKPFENCRIYEI